MYVYIYAQTYRDVKALPTKILLNLLPPSHIVQALSSHSITAHTWSVHKTMKDEESWPDQYLAETPR